MVGLGKTGEALFSYDISWMTLLIEIFQTESDSSHCEQKKSPVDHSLVVGESGIPRKN